MLPIIRTSANIPSVWDDVFGDTFMSNFLKHDNSYASPSVNIAENAKEYRIEIAVPGMNKDDFKLSIEDKVLTISSEKESKKEENDEKYMRREFHYSSFKRSFILPESANGEKISAGYKDGILNVVIPKKEEAAKLNREIKVS